MSAKTYHGSRHLVRMKPEQRRALIERLQAGPLPPLRLRYTPLDPHPRQAAFLYLQNREAFYGGAAGPGKSVALLMAALMYDQPVSQTVWTPSGPRCLGDLGPGDLVCTPDGSTAPITHFLPRGRNLVYRVRFADGRETLASGGHRWRVRGPYARSPDAWWLKTTEQLRAEITGTAVLHGHPPKTPERRRLIQLSHAAQYGDTEPPIDPYALGLLLGDGCLTNKSGNPPSLGMADRAPIEYVSELYQRPIRPGPAGLFVSLPNLRRELDAVGLLGTYSDTKFVPPQYLAGSIATRLSILQGLLDTDGSVATGGGTATYASISQRLATDVVFLARSLGAKASIHERDGMHHVYISGRDAPRFFRLGRKVGRFTRESNPKVNLLAITSIEPVEEQETACISVGHPDGLYLTDDFIVTHNCDVPGYDAILFRRTYPELAMPGGLIPTSKEWLLPLGVKWNEQRHQWTFQSGATLTFGHMQYEDDRFNYHGPEFNFIGFDELTTFTERQYRYLFGRLRRTIHSKGSASDGTTLQQVPLRVRGASNPGGPGHDWVKRRLVERESRRSDRIFIRAKLSDNPHLDREAYEEALGELSPTDRLRLLEGDWSITEEGNTFKREWFQIVDTAPPASLTVRAWDMAATEPGKGKDPDWTVGMRVSWSDEAKRFTIESIIRCQVGPGRAREIVRQTAKLDGQRVRIYGEQEPGSAGKEIAADYHQLLRGYIVKWERATGSKIDRARGAAAAAENGLIQIVNGPWVEDFLDEVSRFPGGHDDQVDTLSKAVTKLRQPGRTRIRRATGALAR